MFSQAAFELVTGIAAIEAPIKWARLKPSANLVRQQDLMSECEMLTSCSIRNASPPELNRLSVSRSLGNSQ